jgi:N-acetylmuramoyl-L-alanine amidase
MTLCEAREMPKTHVVRQGEHLARIAHDHGFADAGPIRDEPANADLWKRRLDPNILLPGDRLVIPDKQRKTVQCRTEATHEIRIKQVPNRLRIILEDHGERPLADEPFTLTIRDHRGPPITGRTSDEGLVDVPLPPGAGRALLALDDHPALAWDLFIGHLDPAHDPIDKKAIVTGAQARLNNLGYRCGEVDGELGPKTRAAIVRFQHNVMKRHPADGDLDAETCKALEGKHGS